MWVVFVCLLLVLPHVSSRSASSSDEKTATTTTTTTATPVEGDTYQCSSGANYFYFSVWTLFGVGEFICDVTDCCRETLLFLSCECGVESCPIECSAYASCRDSFILLNNAASILCDAERACKYSEFVVEATTSGIFSIQCLTGDSACKYGEFYVTFREEIEDGASISCTANHACYDTYIELNNLTENTIVINTLDCETDYSCIGLNIAVPEGEVVITECKCGDNGCTNAVGLEICTTCDGASCPA